jgi:UDP-N-acetyl-D-mannosaminuronate dehydrogenase
VQRDVAVVGAGYVGLPLAVRLAEAGRTVVCLDPAADKMERLNAGDSYIEDVASADLKRLRPGKAITVGYKSKNPVTRALLIRTAPNTLPVLW